MEYIDNLIVRVKELPMVDFLKAEGIKITPNGYFALRPEHTPSAVVCRHDPTRFWDFGTGKSGSVIDAYLTKYPHCNVIEAARNIWERHFLNTTESPMPITATTATMTSATAPKYKIVWRGEPTFYPLRQYAAQRHIPWDIACDLLDEIAFQYVKQYDSTKQPITMRCFGWGNDTSLHGRNGYITSTYPSGFKAVLAGTQDITPYNNGSSYVVITEGIFSMLAALCIPELNELQGDWIVLNSVGNIDKAVMYCRGRGYKRVGLMLDNDRAGREATDKMLTALGDRATDLNQRYQILRVATEGCDLNDLLKIHPHPVSKSCRRCTFFQWCATQGYTKRGLWTLNARRCKCLKYNSHLNSKFYGK